MKTQINRQWPFCRLLALTAPCLILATESGEARLASARSLALGGAEVAIAVGPEGATANPANLGLTGHRRTGIQFLGAGATVNNNSFSLEDYNAYTGKYLTDEDKQFILSRIPEKGLRVKADIYAVGGALSLGSIALYASGGALADMNVSKQVFELALYGNQVGDTVDLTGTNSDAFGYGAANLAYGFQIYRNGSRELALGATVRYIRGIAIQQMVKNTGSATTNQDGFAGAGELIVRTATGGTGYGLDLGAALKINRTYSANLVLNNIYSRVSWNREPYERGFIFDFDTLTYDNFDEDYILADEYENAIDPFATTIPTTVTAGLGKMRGSVQWGVVLEQGFSTSAGSSFIPRLGGGVELRYLPFLPLRVGGSIGGGYDPGFSAGTGLSLPLLYVDVAAALGSGIQLERADGLQFAVSTGMRF